MISSTNPRTGVSAATDLEPTSEALVARLAELAAAAAPALAGLGRLGRASVLDAMAAALESRRELLVGTAQNETGLPEARLNGELSRSIFQLQLFGEALREGSYLEATIDHASETPPGPDVRRMLLPLGPVAVFGSSNFPFAFSVAGGDMASAIAAGCPVILKAHSSHPLASHHSFEALVKGAAAAGAPDGVLGIVYGQEAGRVLVARPEIKAVGFTGSLHAGMALQAIINERDEQIPLYGELSSLNPLVITPGAIAERSQAIGEGLFTSFTGSGGQLCTKPGLAFVPAGPEGQALVDDLAARVLAAEGHVLLNRRIREAFDEIEGRIVGAGATVAAQSEPDQTAGFVAPVTLLTIDAPAVTASVAEECFGPLIVVVRYSDVAEIAEAVAKIPASLTATLHVEDGEAELASELTALFTPLAGRLVYNGFPTGVRVSWGQQHGGPWPSTNSTHTSVGVTAVRRFLRPFAWQDAPSALLPQELRDGYSEVPRRVDGVLQLPA